jgi:hypothetical protein
LNLDLLQNPIARSSLVGAPRAVPASLILSLPFFWPLTVILLAPDEVTGNEVKDLSSV